MGKTIDEVKDYINQYDYGFFGDEVSIYIDKSGRYLIVESDTMTIGNEPKYVLSNFCPSQTPDLSSVKQARYRNGVAFLKNKIDTSIGFCTALSDTMHVCRKKIGDGTLLTTIRDLSDGIIYLYFYHDYKHQVKFNLKDELAKGDHVLEIPALFPANAEYERLINYKTPQNSTPIVAFFVFCGGLFSLSSIFFLVSFLRNRNAAIKIRYLYLKLLLCFVSVILLYYIIALARNQNIFYFPAPYQDYKFSMLNIAAYIPFLLLLIIVPLIRKNLQVLKQSSWVGFSVWLFTINSLSYLVLLILFIYWGFFNVL